MPLSTFIHRMLLAVLLLSSSLTGKASPARYDGYEYCNKAGVAVADVLEERHHRPHDAVLSGIGHVSSAASLQTGHAGGAGGCMAGWPDVLTFISLPLWCGKTQLRRWRLLASVAQYEQLRALYPAHGFW